MISNKDAYNKIARQWTSERGQSFVSKLIIEFADKLKAGSRVLDIGCGGGVPNTSYLGNRRFNVTGIDFSEEMIRIANEQEITNATFELHDILHYKPVKKFDGVLAWDSLFHLPYEHQGSIYEKIAGWVNDKCWFLFSHGDVDGELVDDTMGVGLYYSSLPVDAVPELLTDAGFKIERMTKDYKERDMEKALVVLCQKTGD